MKNALEMAKEVQDYERKKRQAKLAKDQMLENARQGILELTFWEKYVTLPNFKRELRKELEELPNEYGGDYYAYAFFMGQNSDKWPLRWMNYGAYIMEQLGYINVEVNIGILGKPFLKAIVPKTAAEQILFSSKGS